VVPKRDTACRVSSLKVIRAHVAIAAVAVQTSHAARRSLLARVEVLAVLLALAASVGGAEGAKRWRGEERQREAYPSNWLAAFSVQGDSVASSLDMVRCCVAEESFEVGCRSRHACRRRRRFTGRLIDC